MNESIGCNSQFQIEMGQMKLQWKTGNENEIEFQALIKTIQRFSAIHSNVHRRVKPPRPFILKH